MFRRLAALAVAMTSLHALPAFALETGQCLPAAQARQAIADEQMVPLVVGNRSGFGNPTALIFFSNGGGTKGYGFLADRPFGEQATTICVQSVYRDIRVNDISDDTLPRWATFSGTLEEARRICVRERLGYQAQCNFVSDSLRSLAAKGQRLMFSATGTAINPRDNTVRADQRLVLTLDPNDRLGLLKAVTSEGASYVLSAYADGSYTQSGNARLSRR